MKSKYPIVLTIAGSDSSGGAGIQADMNTIRATGCYAASVITVLTAQNTQEVSAIYEVSERIVLKQIEAVFNDLEVKAVKIGMLYSKKIINAVKQGLEKYNPPFVILDPVMVSKTGYELLPNPIVHSLLELFPFIHLLTPNIPEMEKLFGKTINDKQTMLQVSEETVEKYKINILLKGGHLNKTNISSDLLYCYVDKKFYWYDGERIPTIHTHGTGCTLSAAIAAYLAHSFSLTESVSFAKRYLQNAIKAGQHLNIGKGAGPVDHFYQHSFALPTREMNVQ